MSEAALLQGVRDTIRNDLGYRAGECDVEIDEFPPAACGEVYIAVQPNLWTAGPHNPTSGGILDEVYGCKISVIVRAGRVPADKKRTLLLTNVIGLEQRITDIIWLLNQRVQPMTTINAYLPHGEQPFIKPLVFAGCDPAPRVVSAEVFQSGTSPQAGLVRAIYFNAMRRIQSMPIQTSVTGTPLFTEDNQPLLFELADNMLLD